MPKKKVLIVEDESIIALSLKVKLENLNYEVISIVDNGREALDIVRETSPNLVLMDIRIKGNIDGIQTAQALRDDYNIPSIFLTAYVDDDTIERAKTCYPVGYLQKPFDDSDLRSAIEVGLFKEEMQQRLIEQERKLKTAHGIAKLSHWNWNVTKNTGDMSENGYKMLGIEEGYFNGDQFFEQLLEVIHEKDREEFFENFNNSIFSDGEFTCEFRTRNVDSTISYFYIVGKVVEYKENHPKLVSGIIQNITDRKMLELELLSKERQLQETQKLEALGRLSGIIAHDFNNFLTLMLGNIELLEREAPKDMKYYPQFSVMKDSIDYASSLTNQLLTFSRKKVVSTNIIDLNKQIMEIAELLKILAKKHNFVINLEADNATIMAESSQIQQIFLNLVGNAVDAMPNPGTVQIKTSNEILDNSNQYELASGDYVRVEVIDTGSGMDKITKERAFEPFYTTDTSGSHSGIGLSTVFGITKQFNGNIEIQDNPDTSGTVIVIHFPVERHEKKQHEIEVEDHDTTILNNKSILIIEDNEEILNLITTIFHEESGFTIYQAENGEEGIKLYNSMENKVDLVLSDILLPKLSGTQIVEEIQKTNPQQKILLMSGFVDSLQIENFLDQNVQFIPKPFKIDEFLAKIYVFFNKN